MAKIKCICGCGGMISAYDKRGRPRRFKLGHGIQFPGYDRKCYACGNECWGERRVLNKGTSLVLCNVCHMRIVYSPIHYKIPEIRNKANTRHRAKYKSSKIHVFELLGNKCAYSNQYCSGPLEREHKIPRSIRQMSHTFDREVLAGKIDDKQLACRHHNIMKNDSLHEPFIKDCIAIALAYGQEYLYQSKLDALFSPAVAR